jgi:hypothetical protein
MRVKVRSRLLRPPLSVGHACHAERIDGLALGHLLGSSIDFAAMTRAIQYLEPYDEDLISQIESKDIDEGGRTFALRSVPASRRVRPGTSVQPVDKLHLFGNSPTCDPAGNSYAEISQRSACKDSIRTSFLEVNSMTN